MPPGFVGCFLLVFCCFWFVWETIQKEKKLFWDLRIVCLFFFHKEEMKEATVLSNESCMTLKRNLIGIV